MDESFVASLRDVTGWRQIETFGTIGRLSPAAPAFPVDVVYSKMAKTRLGTNAKIINRYYHLN